MSLKNNFTILFFLGLLIGLPEIINAQSEPSNFRVSFNERRKSILDANEMRATYHNFGQGGRVSGAIADEFPYEYPKNSRREYMLFQMVFVGAEVSNQNSGPYDARNKTEKFVVVEQANLKQDGETGKSWSLNPVVGYGNASNTKEIARSDRGPGSPLGNTWPAVWPDKLLGGGDGWADSWNGYFGRDQFNADQEFYYRMGDDNYDRYINNDVTKYQPDLTDPTRGGLGLLIDTRILAWTQTLISNVHFNIFEVTNDASFDYDKVAFGIWIADLIPGGGNDQPEFDILRSIAYITDSEPGRPNNNFGSFIGEMGIQFLETPGNALDGIDNDGDSFEYDIRSSEFFSPLNTDMTALHLEANGGFFADYGVLDSTLAVFAESNNGDPEMRSQIFEEYSFSHGDKIVEIDNDYNRIIKLYVPGDTIRTRGAAPFVLPEGGFTRAEDFYIEGEIYYNERNPLHTDQIDNDFDGLIDENIPSHLEKNIILPNGSSRPVALRFINYLKFAVGDTIQPGLLVSNRQIRDRMQSDPTFASLITNDFGGTMKNKFTAAPMLDEARDDNFDNDDDWVASSDDVGLEGDADSPSRGSGDGLPTSGAGTPFPGEPSIDKTDVSESDLIGVSRAVIFRAATLVSLQDRQNWNKFLVPGPFLEETADDRDIFVSSSIFPLRRGQTERFAVAISAVQEETGNELDDRAANNRSLESARQAYEADYQFATAPLPPILTAVAGDGVVTLYWDTSSEASFDRYVNRVVPGKGLDFEGYKVYRSNDAGFNDIRNISSGFGSPQFRTPIAIFDKVNEHSGFHPVPVRGTQFNMGNNSGLQRFFVDSTVVNGKEYFYAVTGFDFGVTEAGIAPSESSIQSSRETDGTVTLGQNVVRVIPAASQAGYIDAENPSATPIKGTTGGKVLVEVIDPIALVPSTYRVSFTDTVLSGGATAPDTLVTKGVNIVNIGIAPVDTLLADFPLDGIQDVPVINGMRLSFQNISGFGINNELTRYSESNDGDIRHPIQAFVNVKNPKPSDYAIVILGDGEGQSSDRPINTSTGVRSYTAKSTNFKVINLSEDREIEYALFESPSDPFPNQLGAQRFPAGLISDFVVFIEDFAALENVDTWKVQFSPIFQNGQQTSVNPKQGDTLYVTTIKPFTSLDEFEFKIEDKVNVPYIDDDKIKDDLDKIKVVPNPYIVTSPYELSIINSNNQQQRQLHFTHLPIPSKLKIFTSSGVLVNEFSLGIGDVRVHNGTFIWDMLTKDNLEIAYGIYLFHIEVDGVGSKLGKFAVIK